MRTMLSKLLYLLLLPLFLCSCGEDEKKDEPGDAALTYYNYLIKGDYKAYVSSMVSCDSLGTEFRNRMEILVKQYLAREEEENKGMKSVEMQGEQISKDGKSANVFLDVTYGNGKKENICLTLVKSNDVWRMR